MATFKTDIATANDSGLVRNRLNATTASGDIRYLEATYTTTGTEAASGDTIEIGDIPVGAVVLPELSRVANEASIGGSSVAIAKIGDAKDDDRYSAASLSVDSSNAASTAVTAAIASSVIPRHVVTDETQRLIATFARTNAVTAGKKLKFLIAYRLGH